MDSFTVSTLSAVLGRLLPEPHAGFLSGILFGTRATMTKGLVEAFVTTGTIHIVALSGQNLSIFTGTLASWLTSFVSRRIASLLTLVAIAWFLWFVGPSPSLIRAVIMGSLTLLAVIFGRRNLSLFSLVLAVSIMLLLNPSWIGDLSFQLSVLATLGIILFGGKIDQGTWYVLGQQARGAQASILRSTEDPSKVSVERYGVSGDGSSLSEDECLLYGKKDGCRASPKNVLPMRLIQATGVHLWRLVGSDLRLTLSAQLLTTPLIFFHFHRFSIIAPLTNVLIGWTMPILMGLGWVAAIAGYLWVPLGLLPAWAAWIFLTYVIRAVEVTAGFPIAAISW